MVDLVNGLPDIESRTVRFIGDAATRIAEDHLRILRFFRFFALYGSGRPDAEGLKACARLKDGLAHLSAERVWSELKKTLAAPDQVDDITYRMKWIWWDRPFKLTGIDIGAGQSTLHVTNSYGVNQDIQLHVDGKGTVDRMEVSLRPPPVKSWADVDAAIAKSGAHYSYQVAKVVDGKCVKVAGTNVDEPMPLASIDWA